MGAYINPETETKESFLSNHGTLVSNTEEFEYSDCPEGSLPVILIDNGFFTTAGIAYSESEYQAFTMPDDPRPRTLWIVPIDKLLKVSDLERFINRED